MTKIYDFTKYLSDKQIEEYELTPYDQEFLDQMIWAEQIMGEDRDVLRVFFGCPDCECSEFNINLAAEAFCAECGLQILMVIEDDIQ